MVLLPPQAQESEDEETTTRLSSDLNNDDGAIAENEEESSKSENGRGRTKLLRALITLQNVLHIYKPPTPFLLHPGTYLTWFIL